MDKYNKKDICKHASKIPGSTSAIYLDKDVMGAWFADKAETICSFLLEFTL